MRFVLPASAIDDSTVTIDAIDRLFDRVMDEVHVLILPDADLLEQSAWLLGLRPHRKEFLRQTVLASAFRPVPMSGPHRITQTIGTDLDAVQAAALSRTPLIILVENERTDGLLVNAAMQIYSTPEARRLWLTAFLTGPSREIRSRGGQGELGHLLAEICDQAAAARLPVRLLALTESDGKFPGDESARAGSLRTDCANRGIPIKILSCKTIENYIPDLALDLWSSVPDRSTLRPAVAAVKRLPPDGRDHFPMKGKKGSRATRPTRGMAAIDRNPDTPAQQKDLFLSVAPTDRAALDDGFSDDIIDVIGAYLPQLSAADFDARDRRGDLRDLVTMITDLL